MKADVKEQAIGDYAYLAKKEENLTPYQEYMEGQGGRETMEDYDAT